MDFVERSRLAADVKQPCAASSCGQKFGSLIRSTQPCETERRMDPALGQPQGEAQWVNYTS